MTCKTRMQKTTSLLYHYQHFNSDCIWETRRESYKKQEVLTLRQHLISHSAFWLGPCCSLFFLCCSILCLYVLSSVLWFPLRFPWQHRQIKTKQFHNTICVWHNYVQRNAKNVNKTLALLQTTGSKDEPNIT
jgi:hypothetical protein